MIGRSFFAIVGTFFSITPALVYLVAGWTIANGSDALSAGDIVAFTTLQSRLFFPIGSMLQVSTDVHSSLALFDRIFEYLDMEQEIEDEPGALPLRDVARRGRARSRPVPLRDPPETATVPDLHPRTSRIRSAREWTWTMSRSEIQPGQLAALVGPSGAGKTTITYLVPRMYEVQRGAVRIDGHDVRTVTLESHRRDDRDGDAGDVPLPRHDPPEPPLREARGHPRGARGGGQGRQHPRPASMELPEGYDTVVGERGYKLSGGEKQRLAIARVILKDPRILILDEATSSLDTTSERLVQAALEPLMHGRTTIAIAHRLSTILAADVIFVLDRGRIVEQGTPRRVAREGWPVRAAVRAAVPRSGRSTARAAWRSSSRTNPSGNTRSGLAHVPEPLVHPLRRPPSARVVLSVIDVFPAAVARSSHAA